MRQSKNSFSMILSRSSIENDWAAVAKVLNLVLRVVLPAGHALPTEEKWAGKRQHCHLVKKRMAWPEFVVLTAALICPKLGCETFHRLERNISHRCSQLALKGQMCVL